MPLSNSIQYAKNQIRKHVNDARQKMKKIRKMTHNSKEIAFYSPIHKIDFSELSTV